MKRDRDEHEPEECGLVHGMPCFQTLDCHMNQLICEVWEVIECHLVCWRYQTGVLQLTLLCLPSKFSEH